MSQFCAAKRPEFFGKLLRRARSLSDRDENFFGSRSQWGLLPKNFSGRCELGLGSILGSDILTSVSPDRARRDPPFFCGIDYGGYERVRRIFFRKKL